MFFQLRQQCFKQIALQHASGPGKLTEATRALRAAQVTTGGRFNTYIKRQSILDRFSCYSRIMKSKKKLKKIPCLVKAHFTDYADVVPNQNWNIKIHLIEYCKYFYMSDETRN